MESGRWQVITSTLTIMELKVPAWCLGVETVARYYEALLINFPNLDLVNITREVARQAAMLRARYGLRPPDALQAGTGLVCKATAFLANDRALTRLNEVLDVFILDDYAIRT